MMEKRKIIFGTYDTAVDGLLTLTGWEFSPAVAQTNYVSVPGRHGQLDLSFALTDGEPVYDSRTLTATFETSEGTRLERKERFDTMVNWLDGWSMDIQLPDDDTHYITGRVHVAVEYNDVAHGAVTVTAVCDPWRYFTEERVVILTAGTEAQTATLVNTGRKSQAPTLTITGDGASVLLAYGSYSWTLSAGVYVLPDLVLVQGDNALTYSGTGTVEITYREADL